MGWSCGVLGGEWCISIRSRDKCWACGVGDVCGGDRG